MKSGTTYLDHLLRRHPMIAMPKRSMKQSFFDNDLIYPKGEAWYESIFDQLEDQLLIGQTSADCAFNSGSIERIKSALPDVKLLFIIRDPLNRAYSLYWHQLRMGREYLSFEKAIEKEEQRMKKSYYHYKMYSYLSRSRYARQVANIYTYFDPDQVLFIPFELFIKNELKSLNRIFAFLNVDEISDLAELKIEHAPRNPAKVPNSMAVVKLSYFLQQLKLVRLGRYILNKNMIVKRPPKMEEATRAHLMEMMQEDIAFHQNLIKEWKGYLKLSEV